MKNVIVCILIGCFFIVITYLITADVKDSIQAALPKVEKPVVQEKTVNKRQLPKVKGIAELKATKFAVTPNSEFSSDENMIYCSTLGYAWQEIKHLLKQPNLLIPTSEQELVDLDTSTFFANSLTSNEIEVTGEVGVNEMGDKVVKAKAKFQLSLEFDYKFERNNIKTKFYEEEVESFGLKYDESDIAEQIDVLFYESDDEFALRLSPKEAEHEIILYMPKDKGVANLQVIHDRFTNQIRKHNKVEKTHRNNWRYHYSFIDRFSLPILEFNLENNFEELIGNQFVARDTLYEITKAYQRIGLLLDEKGAEVESEAEVAVEEASEAPMEDEGIIKPTPKRLIFDKPFLIQFKRRDSKNPYLVAWIANTELMKVKK